MQSGRPQHTERTLEEEPSDIEEQYESKFESFKGDSSHVDHLFFFQAEDGIRDLTVTGVQTCALPIFLIDGQVVGKTPVVLDNISAGEHLVEVKQTGYLDAKQPFHLDGGEQKILAADLKIGRASCRERE